MPNLYFRFRQFTVQQDRCAMKVCTDASLFGAWLAQYARSAATSLDIGTGTGLLSLMVAQKSKSQIDAVEIDPVAAMQAAENFRHSPWTDRLRVINSGVQDYAASFSGGSPLYDFIFSNPPFFSKDLRSADSRRNLALHSEALSLEELAAAAAQMLRPEGIFAAMIPFHRAAYWEGVAAGNGFHPAGKLIVRQTPEHEAFRVLYLLSRTPAERPSIDQIVIKDVNQQYTREFSKLMRDYYLAPDKALP